MTSSQQLSRPLFVILVCAGYAYIGFWILFMFRTSLLNAG